MSDTVEAPVASWTHEGYEMVVGLEVHVELATETKLFSGSPNRFGDDPNTNIDPVTLGLPGQHGRALGLADALRLPLRPGPGPGVPVGSRSPR